MYMPRHGIVGSYSGCDLVSETFRLFSIMVLPIKISIKLAGNGDVEMSKKMVFNLQKAHILMKESVNKRQRNTSYDSP